VVRDIPSLRLGDIRNIEPLATAMDGGSADSVRNSYLSTLRAGDSLDISEIKYAALSRFVARMKRSVIRGFYSRFPLRCMQATGSSGSNKRFLSLRHEDTRNGLQLKPLRG
jgi:hypothetical protein